MSRVDIVSATYEDALRIADNMRQEDVTELRDISRMSPHEAVLEGLNAPGETLVARWKGRPIALLGCATTYIMGNVGSPWLVGTRMMDRVGLAVVREARVRCAAWAERYGLLENLADARNVKTLRWLAAVGFDLDAPHEVRPGIYGVRFSMRGT